MNEEKQQMVTDQALEQILKQAGPRPAPKEADVSSARQALHAEWLQVTRRRKRKRYIAGLAAAATLVLALAITVNLMQVPPSDQPVAQIDKATGPIFVLGDSDELKLREGLSTLLAGETIRTGGNAMAGLRLESGASLRIDENTSINFISPNEVRLDRGRVYVDSKPEISLRGGGYDLSLIIRTPYGAVRHAGTQYITEVLPQQLVISVREGRVLFEQQTALAGEQLVTDGLDTRRRRVASHGSLWQWTEMLAPVISVDQRRADEFLNWVGRETGLSIEYADAATEENAAATILSGTIDAPPRTALRAWSLAADYTLEIDERDGVIRIGKQ